MHNYDLPDLNISNVNNVFDEILEIISSTINTHAPLKLASRKKQKISSKPWLTKGIIKSIRHKQFIHKSFYLSGSDQQKLFYRRYANKLTKVKQLSKNLYFENEFNNSDNPRKMWKTLRNLLPSKMSCSVPKVLEINNSDVNHPADIANHFNNYFCGIGKSLADQINDSCNKDPSHFLRNRIPESIFIAPTYPQEIERIMSSLRNSFSSGPEGFFSFLIKTASTAVLASTLSFIFNFCFENGIFPESLKISKVIPIYNSGAKSEVNNYRPISLLPVLSKVFEKVLHKRITSFVEKHSVLSSTQYGFRANYSPEHAVLDVVSTCYNNISNKQYTGLIMLDLKKAFDSVTHTVLLSKLDHYGIRGNAHKLLSSYLCNRRQYVNINNVNSDTQSINYGVPQGSILRPLLFLLYINDLENSVNNTPRLFADDTCIIAMSSSILELEQHLNLELNNIASWISANKLTLNPAKFFALIVSPKSKNNSITMNLSYQQCKIEVVDCVKYLGIHLDNKLQFKQHIEMLETKLSRLLGVLYKTKSFLPNHILKKLYYAFIHSHWTFGLLVWSATSKSNLSKLQRIQNKAIRLLAGAAWRDHASPLCAQLNILSLDKLVLLVLASFMHKYHLQKLPKIFDNIFTLVSSIYSRSTRNSSKYQQYFIPQFATNLLQRHIKFRGSKIWNIMPDKLKQQNHKQFKHKYKKLLLTL